MKKIINNFQEIDNVYVVDDPEEESKKHTDDEWPFNLIKQQILKCRGIKI